MSVDEGKSPMPPVLGAPDAPGRDEKGEGSLGLISGIGAAWRMGGEVVVPDR